MKHIALGIGSNLGNRTAHIEQACKMLNKHGVNILSVSSPFENPALLPINAPKEWNKDYINVVALAHTALSPYKLLKCCQQIEAEIGRTRDKKWQPREIDIDLLLYADQVINQEELVVPHVGTLSRIFFLEPLSQQLPNFKWPVIGQYYQQSLKSIYDHIYGK